MLYRKAQYTLALSLARTQHLDAAAQADIRRRYGDHLCAKGEYDAAMAQFVQTIGSEGVQPSYVIRKVCPVPSRLASLFVVVVADSNNRTQFLDAQRIPNLVTYLQELHTRGLANADHTTLLLNTYTKLKDVARLDSFVKSSSVARTSSTGADELPFDLDTAIRVCRQAGYFEHAAYLARKYARHEDYLQIQIEDAGNYAEALAYLRKLGSEAVRSLHTHSLWVCVQGVDVFFFFA